MYIKGTCICCFLKKNKITPLFEKQVHRNLLDDSIYIRIYDGKQFCCILQHSGTNKNISFVYETNKFSEII